MREFLKREVRGERPAEAPDGWIVYNAPRPIWGHTKWQGDFVTGVFYAAVDPEMDDADEMVAHNQLQHAAELTFISEEEWRRRVEEYGRKMSAEYEINLDDFEWADIEASYANWLRQEHET